MFLQTLRDKGDQVFALLVKVLCVSDTRTSLSLFNELITSCCSSGHVCGDEREGAKRGQEAR